MRFELIFQLKNKTFPIDYRRVILSYIKKALQDMSDGKYYDKYFKDTIQKDFSFSVKFPKMKFTKENIELEEDKIKVLFTTDNTKKTGLLLQQSFIKQKYKDFNIANNNSMTLIHINQKREQKITSSKVIFKTYGLCVRDHNKQTNKDIHYTYQDEKFNEQLKIVLTNQAKEAGFSQSLIDNLKFIPLNCKKVLIKHYGVYVDTTVGTFFLEGHPSLLQYLYNVGLGSRRAMFGYLDLVTQDL